MRKTQINPGILQDFFESASNAAGKGQAQFFTPPDWAAVLAIPLPRYRPVLIDPHCGAGHLLQGAARGSTDYLLGCDIDPCPLAAPVKRVTADANKLFRLMRQVDFRADCWVLNPPWDLHQYREPLLALDTEWELATVRRAFQAHDGRTAKDTIDSTIASLCLALDRSSEWGEGLLIANEATLQRLLFAPDAAHRGLCVHIWAHLVIQGNPMTCLQNCAHQEQGQFQTGVIYFARGHDTGCPNPQTPARTSLEEVRIVCEELYRARIQQRTGPEIKSYQHTEDTAERWQAIAEEWERLNRKDRPQWNLTVRPDGTIKTDLSLFDQQSGRVDKTQAAALHDLNGKLPLQLVMQRAQRAHLERAAFGNGGGGANPWRVDPKLQDAVRKAVNDYHAIRAPLYPLSPIQRLGYLDECDEIQCRKNLSAVAQGLCFQADHTYQLRSTTVAVQRTGTKLNLSGEEDDVVWNGQELAFWIVDDHGTERLFMEARLRNKDVRVSILKPGEKPGKQDERNLDQCAIDFTLQQLVSHFLIPDVPDVARVNPEAYERNLQLLQEIESLSAAA